MKKAIIKESLPLFTRETEVPQIPMEREDYLFRIGLLRARMAEDGVDIALLFGDREHFSNIEYFSGYDCRFEEGILAIPREGTPTIVCGNEGMGYSYAIPYEINRVYYRNLSLQGQPRRAEEKLDEIFRVMGVNADSRVGVIGYKYFLPEYIGTDPNGIGGKIVVRVTYADGTIQDVEVLEQNETPEFGGAALEELPGKVVEANSTDVDGVTGATITSKAFFAAVQNAIAKA